MHIHCSPHVNVDDSEVDSFEYHDSQHYKLPGWEDL